MRLELHPNDNAREGQPGVWFFSGRTAIVPVIGVMVFVALYRIFDSIGVEWWFNLVVSITPLVAASVVVRFAIIGKAPSYAEDLIKWYGFRFRQWMWVRGWLTRPPQFWIKPQEPPLLDDK